MSTTQDQHKPSMQKIVGLQFRESGKIYDYDPGPFVLKKGDKVVVITEEGPAVGVIKIGPHNLGEKDPKRALKRIYRLATSDEVAKYESNRVKEKAVYEYCTQRITEIPLPMCLVAVERHFDGSKIIVYFTADGRVDFRELVKDLVQKFRCRIEMRQIGVRQQARMVGGLGPCGRSLCCATFLTNFAPVTIKMAKGQNISLNPDKISGMCGRLMCCLNYEFDHYEKFKRSLPKVSKKVMTKEGEGKVIRQNALKETLTIALDSGGEVEVKSQDLIRDGIFKKKPKKKGRQKGHASKEKQQES